jgi:hypothetical protein
MIRRPGSKRFTVRKLARIVVLWQTTIKGQALRIDFLWACTYQSSIRSNSSNRSKRFERLEQLERFERNSQAAHRLIKTLSWILLAA